MKRRRIFVGVGGLLAGLILQGCTGAGTMIRIPFIKYPVERTYKANFDRTWKAALEATKDYELTIADPKTGYLISDWIKGLSDTYRYRDQNGEQKPCRCEFSIHGLVEEAADGKTRVHIPFYERTLIVHPDTGPVWKKTESSTLREKAILDKIGELLAKD